MSSIADWLRSLNGSVVYLVVGLLVFAEDALFVGFVIPGETAAVLGGLAAHQGQVSLAGMIAVVVVAAIAGDSVGYEVGRHFGPRLLANQRLMRHEAQIDKARGFLRDHGPSAVFLGRFVAFFRAVIPALSGLSRMPYPTFLRWNALGGLVWGVGFVLLGYIAGDAYKRVEQAVGAGLAVAIAVIVIAAFVTWRIRKMRAEAREEREHDERKARELNAGEDAPEPAEQPQPTDPTDPTELAKLAKQPEKPEKNPGEQRRQAPQADHDP
jgi:membrane protein DedA with SNARE-associated domain